MFLTNKHLIFYRMIYFINILNITLFKFLGSADYLKLKTNKFVFSTSNCCKQASRKTIIFLLLINVLKKFKTIIVCMENMYSRKLLFFII